MNTETRIKEVQTRHNENRFTAMTPEDMFGHYAAENIYHTWNEDFKDQDSGEIVTVERKQLLFEKGTYFDNRNIDKVRFCYDAGEFSSAVVTNQCRLGTESEHWGLQAYKVKVSVDGKNRIIVCQARSLTMAHEIVRDWCELHLDKVFLIMAVSELSTGIILNAVLKKRGEEASESAEAAAEELTEEPLPLDVEEDQQAPAEEDGNNFAGSEDEDKAKKKSSGYYEVLLNIRYRETKTDSVHTDMKGFLVQADDADAARDACFGYIDLNRSDDDTVEEIRIVSATPFNCFKVIEREFTAAYIDAEKNETNNQ